MLEPVHRRHADEKMIVIAASSTQPCRVSPANLPTMYASPAGISRIASDLQEVRERRGVLEGMRRVGVEEAAAVGAELLDRLLRGDRPLGDGLGAPSTVLTCVGALKLSITPCETNTTLKTSESGSST